MEHGISIDSSDNVYITGSPNQFFGYAGTYDISLPNIIVQDQKVVITYKDSGNSYAGTAIVTTDSGNNIYVGMVY